jgi:hypothetical protein
VAVSVATVWTDPHKPRPLEAPALGNPVDVRQWLANMELADKYGLSEQNISQTQVLYGEPVHVLETVDGWCRIAVPGQSTPKNALGYPGWMPAAQLSEDMRFAAATTQSSPVTVTRAPTAWLYADRSLRTPVLEVSFLTRLPLVDRTDGAWCLDTPHGPRWIAVADVAAPEDRIGRAAPECAELLEIAKEFLGLPYLWGGRSGFAPDCSGLTSLVYAAVGIDLPRDASAQAVDAAGTKIEIADLRAGDLLFWANDTGAGSVHHVAMCMDRETMIEAPGSADPVRITPIRFDEEYCGARRFLRS